LIIGLIFIQYPLTSEELLGAGLVSLGALAGSMASGTRERFSHIQIWDELIYLNNIKFGTFGTLFGFLIVCLMDGKSVMVQGFFHDYTYLFVDLCLFSVTISIDFGRFMKELRSSQPPMLV
jgi:hypothetical protein